uniref:Gamma-glutamyltransferase n=1 Tax=Strigamia maritima TaxID=126957 RepID=T1JDL0_STRMM
MTVGMSDKIHLIATPNSKETNSKLYGTFDSHHLIEKQTEQQPWCLCSRRDVWALSIISLFIIISITTTLAIGIPSIQQKRLFQLNKTKQSASTNAEIKNSTYHKAAIASDDPRCSAIGNKIMKQNGSAVDAAISTLLCLEVVNPHHSGIGGGFFMTLYDSISKESVVMDAREFAPKNIPPNVSLPLSGGLAVAVPTTLDGFWKIHQRFGRLKWAKLFEPTIELCTNGYEISAMLEEAIRKDKNNILKESSMHELFVNNITGNFLKKNDILKRPVHARTLRIIANEGIASFYNGSLGKSLVSEIQEKGGVLTMEDLASTKSNFKIPLKASLAIPGLSLLTVPPPSSGTILIFMLNLLGQFNTSQDDVITLYQRLVETFKFGFAQRTLLGDETFVDTKQAVANQTSLDFAKITSQRIVDNATFSPDYYLPTTAEKMPSQDHGTSHVSVVDPNGMAVAITCTINNRFGAKFRSRSLDIVLNDEMNDFSEADSIRNSIMPGKKPLSSMVPSIILDQNNDIVLVIGGSGGTGILTSVLTVAWNYLYRMKSLLESVLTPRLHHELIPNILQAEKTFPQLVLSSLKSFGHNFTYTEKNKHVNAIAKSVNSIWIVVSEPRIESGVAGF